MSESPDIYQEIPQGGELERNAKPDDSDEFTLLDLGIALAKHKKFIIGLPILAGILAALYTLTLPPVYTATAKIVPPQSQGANVAVAAQLGGLANLAGNPLMRTTTDLYVGMLKSRTVADNLIERFDFVKYSGSRYLSQARTRLAKSTNIMSGKEGIITIEFEDGDPKRAAAFANGYVEELQKLTLVLAVTEASQRRLFYERQFAAAKDNLVKAEAAARTALQKGGLVQVEGQSRGMIENAARLRGQITVKEVQIGGMLAFASAQNPALVAAQRELDAMRQELAKLEGASSGRILDDTAATSRGMDSVRMLRNVKYYETIYELLAKQYEIAKLDESKDAGMVQVLDVALEPDVKSGPRRTQITLLWALGTGILAVLWVFIREVMSRGRDDSQRSGKLELLRRYLRFR